MFSCEVLAIFILFNTATVEQNESTISHCSLSDLYATVSFSSPGCSEAVYRRGILIRIGAVHYLIGV